MHASIYKMNFLVGLGCWIIYEVSLNVCYPSLHLLWQSGHLLNTVVPSSAGLTCFTSENILLLSHLKQVYNNFSRASCGFSNCLIPRFNFSLTESKTGCSKNWIHVCLNSFSLYLKINMDKASHKVTKDKDPKLVDAGCKGREMFMRKTKEKILSDAKQVAGYATNWSNDTTSPTTNSSNDTSATNNSSNKTNGVTNTATTKTNNTYVYGVGVLAVFSIGVCVFSAYSTFHPIKFMNDKKDQPPKWPHIL